MAMQLCFLGFTDKTLNVRPNTDNTSRPTCIHVFPTLNELDASDDDLLSFDDVYQGWLYRSYTNTGGGKIVVKDLLDGSKLIFTFPDERLQVKNVSCGWDKIYIVADDGSCWFGGLNSYGGNLQEMCPNTIAAKCIDVGDLKSVLLSEDGCVYDYDIKCKDGSATIEPVKTHVPIQSIACGKEHVLLLTIHGTVLSYGLGSRGQLGHGNVEAVKEPKAIEALEGLHIQQISAGGFHSAALAGEGDAYIWGWNESCQLGFPNTRTPGNVAEDEEVLTFQVVPKLLDFAENITDISCGSRHTAALTDDKKFWSWGWNAYGQLGLQGEFVSKPTVVDLPASIESPFQVKCKHWTTVLYSRKSL